MFPGAKGVTWPDLKTKRIPQYVLGVINENNCWLTGKAYGRFKMHGHSNFFLILSYIRDLGVCIFVCYVPEKSPTLTSHWWGVFCLHELPVSLLCHWALVILRWINVIKAIGCLRSFLMHCFGRSTYAVQINTKLVFLLEAFGENEWFVLLMKGAYISAHSCLSAGLFLLMDSEMEFIICQCRSRCARDDQIDLWGWAEQQHHC